MKLEIDFYKSDTKSFFDNAVRELRDKGMENEDIKELLEGLYYAVANEYGD